MHVTTSCHSIKHALFYRPSRYANLVAYDSMVIALLKFCPFLFLFLFLIILTDKETYRKLLDVTSEIFWVQEIFSKYNCFQAWSDTDVAKSFIQYPKYNIKDKEAVL